MPDTLRPTPPCPKCGTAAHWDTKVFTTQTYERAIRKLLSEAERRAMEAAIVADPGPDAIYMLTAYAKADREDLSPADRKVLSRLVAAIKKEEGNR